MARTWMGAGACHGPVQGKSDPPELSKDILHVATMTASIGGCRPATVMATLSMDGIYFGTHLARLLSSSPL